MSGMTGAALRGRLAWSIIDQAALSAFSLGLNLILMRTWGPALFGIFAIILAITMVGYSVQQALIGSQLAVLRPQALDPSDEKTLLASFWMANWFLTALLMATTYTVLALAWHDDFPTLAISGALFVGCALLREYARCLLFSELRVGEVLVTDLVFVGAAIVGLSLVWAGTVDLAQILLVVAGANLIAFILPVLRHPGHFALRFSRSVYVRYWNIWQHQSRWALLGVASWEILNRVHVFIIGSWFGVAAVGVIQAGEMIFRPLGLVLQAWRRIAQPTFAKLFAGHEYAQSRAFAHVSALCAVFVSVAFMVTLWAAWDLLETYVFRGQYGNIELVASLWAMVMMLRLISGVYSTQLEGCARFRELSFTSLAGASVALVGLILVLAFGSYEWSILAIAAGFSVDILMVLVFLSRIFGKDAQRSSPETSESLSRALAAFKGGPDVRQRLSGLQPSK